MKSQGISVLIAGVFLSISAILPASVQLKIVQEKAAENPTHKVTLEAAGNSIVLKDIGAYRTCCYVADGRVDLRGKRIVVFERNAGEVCRCQGWYDLTYTLSRIFPGKYDLAFFQDDGALLLDGVAEVGPIVEQKVLSGCGDPPPGDPEVLIETRGDAIFITQLNVLTNTCLEFAAKVEIEGSTITVRESDKGPPCNCISWFDLSVEIPGLPPGTYTVNLYDLGGKLAGSVEVKIGHPQMIATQARILPYKEIPPSAGIRSEGMGIVAERWYVPLQCCLDFQAEALVARTSVTLREFDFGPPCDCFATFNLRIEALDFDPGTYEVTLEPLPVSDFVKETVVLGEPLFIRGMASDDLSIDISDALSILFSLFVWGDGLPCLDAADPNDDGKVDIADPVYLLAFLFGGGSDPWPPFLLPGTDPTPDGLDCREPPCRSAKFAFEEPPLQAWDFIEFCIPLGEEFQKMVQEIYPAVKFLPGSQGRIRCTDEQVLSIIDWKDLDRSRLCGLSLLDFIREIRGSFPE